MPTSRPRRTYRQILDNIALVRQFTVGLDERAFKSNALVIAAVERCLSRISEAADRLGDDVLAPGLPWGQIRGLGNRLRHAYDSVDLDVIWGVVAFDLDALGVECTKMLATLPPDP